MSDFVIYSKCMKSLKSVDYGMVLFASLKPTYVSGEYFDIHAIAEKHKLPVSFVKKLAQRFKLAGLLESRRGTGGGYRLIKDPKIISIDTVISVLENKFQYCPINRHLENVSPSKK